MQAEEGEERVRKDAVFNPPREPWGIPAGEHNGEVRVMLPDLRDRRHQFRTQTMVHPGGQAVQG